MKVVATPRFRKAVKKLHNNQKRDLDHAVRTIMETPSIGAMKIGDLSGIQIHKFKMNGQLTLLAYQYQNEIVTLTLLSIGTHENFYRDLKH